MAKTTQELAQELSDQLGLDWRSQYSGRNREQVPRRVQTIGAERPTIRSALSNLMRDAIDATGIGGGYRRGLLNAAGGIETGVDFTPVLGDALALEDAAQAYRRGDLIGTGINLIGAIPIAGEFLSKGAKLTKEQIEEGAMTSLREALNVPIDKFKALMGAPRYSGPLSGSGYNTRESRWAMISAENPPNEILTDAENIRRSEELGLELIREYGPDNVSLVKGDYGAPERTYLVEGIDPIAAANLGNKYGQDSVFTDRGILYTSGSGRMGQREQISPLTGSYGQPVYQPRIDPNLTEFYTELQPKTGDPVRLSFDIDFDTPLTYPSGPLTPASARGVHFSKQSGLTETDPVYYGQGSAGAENAYVGAGRKAYGEGPLRTYFYTPTGSASDVVPEPVVTGANRYQTTLRNLYDITTDPEGIRAFSKGPVDMDRMIQSRGYTGYLSSALSDPAAGRSGSAAVFERQPIISTESAEAVGGIVPRSALNILYPKDVGFDDRFSPRRGSRPKASGDYLSQPERDRLNQAGFAYSGDRIVAPSASIVDFEGRPFITTMSDRTAAGYALSGINDVNFDRPVHLYGGQDFMLNDPDLVWASDPKVVDQMYAVSQQLRKSTGQDPIFLPWRMTPSGGDYATMTTDVMYEYAHKNMDSDVAARIDQAIREEGINISKKDADGNTRSVNITAPEWKGIKNPETAEQIANLSGDQRKMIQSILDRDGRNAGGISLGEARLAVSDPSQYNALAGGLQNVGIVDTSRGVTTSSHPTYAGGLYGQGVGRLQEDLQVYQLLPELARYRNLQDPRNPRSNDLRALQMKPYSGILTESLLRKILEGGE